MRRGGAVNGTGIYDAAIATTARPAELDPRDFLAIDALLDDEERAIRDTVRQFVRERVVPNVGDWFERGVVPRELVAELAELGLFGMHLEGYGLPGASSRSAFCSSVSAKETPAADPCSTVAISTSDPLID